MNQQIRRPVRFIIMFLAALWALRAQVPQGQILGSVSDPSGAAVSGATVILENQNTGIRQNTSTADSGNFVFSYLDSGTYRLRIERAGFKVTEVPDILLQLAEKRRVDAQLEVGEVSTTVEVRTTTALVETDSSTIGSMVSQREVVGLPLNGRQFSQLALLEPGVVARGTTGGAIVTTFATAVQVGGTSQDKNFYSLDGVDNTFNFFNGPAMNPSIDSMQEFRIERNLASAEYGQGGAQLQVVTKSGTNQFHGVLWEYFRNYQMNAGNYFTHLQDSVKRNQFGANIGGPIKRNKAFFFFNWESQRERSSVQPMGTVFTDRMRNGDLGEIAQTPVDPLNGMAFPNKIIPASRRDAVTVDHMDALMPRANRPGIVGNLIKPFTTATDWNAYLGRVDYRISERDDLFFRYAHQPRNGIGAPLGAAWLNATEDFKFWNFGSGWTRTWTPRTTSETRFGLQGQRILVDTVPPEKQPTTTILGLGGGPVDHLPVMNIQNFDSFGQAGNPLGFNFNAYEFIQNVSFFRSKHLIKTGVKFRKFDVDTPLAYTKNTWPFLTFTSAFTGVSAADYLIGYPFTALGILEHVPREQNYNDLAAFVQDDWKISRSLTLNLGVRYDLRTRATEAHNIWANFGPSQRKIIIAGDSLNEANATKAVLDAYRSFLIPASQTELPIRSLSYGDHNNFAGRFGFAWRPFRNNKTVLRGGYGIYYLLPDGNIVATNQYSIPFGGRVNVVNTTPIPSFTAGAPFGTNLSSVPPPSSYYRDPYIRDAYLQQANISIQRELPWGMVAEVNFQDQNSLKLESSWDFNAAVPGSAPLQQRRPYPEYVGLNGAFAEGHGRYDALEMMVRKASTHLTFQGSYTWAKNMVAGPNIDAYNRHRFDGPGVYFAHVVKFHFLADLPLGKGRRWMSQNPVADAVFGGWTLAMILQPYISGSPLTVAWNGDPVGIGIAQVRPNSIGRAELSSPTLQRWFDTSAFVAPTPGTFGNSGTGILFGPSSFYADGAIHKTFTVHEAVQFQIRGEAFNVFNHPNYGNPATTANGFGFGQITSRNFSPRVMQVALRLTF